MQRSWPAGEPIDDDYCDRVDRDRIIHAGWDPSSAKQTPKADFAGTPPNCVNFRASFKRVGELTAGTVDTARFSEITQYALNPNAEDVCNDYTVSKEFVLRSVIKFVPTACGPTGQQLPLWLPMFVCAALTL